MDNENGYVSDQESVDGTPPQGEPLESERPMLPIDEGMKSAVEGRARKKPPRALTTLLVALLSAAAAAAVVALLFYQRYGSELKIAGEYSVFLEAAQTVEDRFVGECDKQAMSDYAITGLVQGLGDRWSHYVTSKDITSFEEDRNNAYVGIGVRVTKAEGEGLLVSSTEDDGGALAAGIVAGDTIIAVGGTSILDMSLADAKALVVGEAGTYVRITVLKASGTTIEYNVERRYIEENPVTWELIGTVGYIKIDNFNSGVADKFIAGVKELTGEGATSLVFDVRFNGGGMLNEMTEMLDYLLPEGRIFYSVDNTGDKYEVNSSESCVEMPMAVLVNDSSYSAAEFFAACLQEYHWATVVGQHTTGKGYSQSTIYLADGSALVISTRKYYTPSGKNLADDGGIAPDIEITISEEEYTAVYNGTLAHTDDKQLQAAIEAVEQ